MDSRRGLLLVGMPGTAWPRKELRVCNPATGRTRPSLRLRCHRSLVSMFCLSATVRQAVGRSFRVLKANLVLKEGSRSTRRTSSDPDLLVGARQMGPSISRNPDF
jgi:hypothetical protein